MKNILPVLLGVALLPMAAQATSTSNVVGYETLNLIPNAFNYLGLRLHNPITMSGELTAVTTSSVTDTSADFSGLDANTLYLLEIEDGSGATSEFLGSDVVTPGNDTINLMDDLVAIGVAVGADYSIRAASSLADVFGAANEAGLSQGVTDPSGADIVLIPDGSGGFDSYFYDQFGGPMFSGGWKDADTLADVADPALVPLAYLDGVLISASANAPASITVSGEVKTGPTRVALLADAFTYLSSVAPASNTLATAIDPAQLDQGVTDPSGADLVLIPDGSGGFTTYFYDQFGGPMFDGGWKNADTLIDVDPATVTLGESGILISNNGAAAPLVIGVPASYSTL